MARKARNPNWGKPMAGICGVEVTAFETMAKRLGLNPDDYQNSPALQTWVRANRTKRYVPEHLLIAWGLEVDADSFNLTPPRGA